MANDESVVVETREVGKQVEQTHLVQPTRHTEKQWFPIENQVLLEDRGLDPLDHVILVARSAEKERMESVSRRCGRISGSRFARRNAAATLRGSARCHRLAGSSPATRHISGGGREM